MDLPPDRTTTRRAVLAAAAGATAGLAGCQGDGAATDAPPTGSTPAATAAATGTSAPTATATPEPPCVPGERVVEGALDGVTGAWPQFQAGPGNAGSADGAGPTAPSVAWRYATCGRLADAPPVVADGTVYLGGDSLRAFDAATGAIEWVVDGLQSPTAPVVTDDAVYVAGRDLTAVDRADGAVRWRDRRRSDVLAHGSPTLADGTLYVPGAVDDPRLRAVDAATGEERWTLELEGEFGPAAPAVADGRVLVTDDGGRLVAVEADGGDARVVAGGPDDAGVLSPPVVVDGTAYVGGLEGRVRAFDAATGERRWARRTGGGGVLPPPVVGDGRVYALNADAIHAFTTDGDRVWSRPTDGSRYLVGDGETLYAGGYAGADVDEGAPAGLVVAHDAGDGRERWRHLTRGYRDERGGDVRAGTEAPLAVIDGVVFAATGAGDVYAFA